MTVVADPRPTRTLPPHIRFAKRQTRRPANDAAIHIASTRLLVTRVKASWKWVQGFTDPMCVHCGRLAVMTQLGWRVGMDQDGTDVEMSRRPIADRHWCEEHVP